jgi:uncharacterized protein YndB with AHSA1/START domain
MPGTATTAANLAPADRAARTLTITRVFKAPPAEVFRAWTDPALLMRWWGPEDFSARDVSLDLRAGGAWRIRMVGPEGDHVVSGTYREVSAPRRLVMSWAWEESGNRGHETLVAVDFAPAGRWTEVRLVQQLFETPEQAANHNWGWPSSFVKLDTVLK